MATTSKPDHLRLVDDDHGEITITIEGREIRGWSYANENERRVKMLAAREFIEGYYVGFNAGMDRVAKMIDEFIPQPVGNKSSPDSVQ